MLLPSLLEELIRGTYTYSLTRSFPHFSSYTSLLYLFPLSHLSFPPLACSQFVPFICIPDLRLPLNPFQILFKLRPLHHCFLSALPPKSFSNLDPYSYPPQPADFSLFPLLPGPVPCIPTASNKSCIFSMFPDITNLTNYVENAFQSKCMFTVQNKRGTHFKKVKRDRSI